MLKIHAPRLFWESTDQKRFWKLEIFTIQKILRISVFLRSLQHWIQYFHKNFQGANIDENGTTSIPGGLCQSQKLSLANQSLRGSKLNISGSTYDSLLWFINNDLSINEQGSVMQIRGQTQVLQSRVGYPNLIASQTGCFITHQLLDFKRSLPLKGKHPVFRTENISCKHFEWP